MLAILASGCRPADAIRTYDAPKPPGRVAASTDIAPSASTEKTHRMLALVLPGGGQAWFFKLVGEKAAVAPLAESITKFYRGVRIGDDGKPKWELPEDWSAAPPARMRLATITVAGELEMSVIGLPLIGDWDAQLLDNVNRWRGQLGLPPTDAARLADNAQPVESVDEAAIIDLVGSFSAGGMTAPFARGGRPATPPAQPAGPIARPPLVPGSSVVSFTIPDGWQDRGATAMRKANLLTSDGDQAAEVRAMSFPAFGQMGDPQANLNRWRDQVGQPPVGADEVADAAKSVRVAGEDAMLFEIAPKSVADGGGQNAVAITAAMFKRGDQVWFFMMSGPAETVAAERPRYDEWLASIRFTGDANDDGKIGEEAGGDDGDDAPGSENNNEGEADDGDR